VLNKPHSSTKRLATELSSAIDGGVRFENWPSSIFVRVREKSTADVEAKRSSKKHTLVLKG
jgi:hypothetical protein